MAPKLKFSTTIEQLENVVKLKDLTKVTSKVVVCVGNPKVNVEPVCRSLEKLQKEYRDVAFRLLYLKDKSSMALLPANLSANMDRPVILYFLNQRLVFASSNGLTSDGIRQSIQERFSRFLAPQRK